MSEHFLKAKFLADQLAMVSKPVDDEYYILYVLGSLNPKHALFVTFVTTHESQIQIYD